MITQLASVDSVYVYEQFISQPHEIFEKNTKGEVWLPGSIPDQLHEFEQSLSLQLFPSESYDCENLNK